MQIKAVRSLNHPIEGMLLDKFIGKTGIVVEQIEDGYMVQFNGEVELTLVLFGECEIVS